MRQFEVLFIVRPELDEAQVQEAVGSVSKLIESLGGTAQPPNIWGKRRLAYEVDKLREGYYVLIDFEIDGEQVAELERNLKISETVFRHIVVRKPVLKTAAAARRRRREAAAKAVQAEAEAAAAAQAEAEATAAATSEAGSAASPEAGATATPIREPAEAAVAE